MVRPCAGPATVAVLGGGPERVRVPADLALRVDAAASTLGAWQCDLDPPHATIGSRLASAGSRLADVLRSCIDSVRAPEARALAPAAPSGASAVAIGPACAPGQPAAPPPSGRASDEMAPPVAVGIPTGWMPYVGVLRPAELHRRACTIGARVGDVLADRGVPRSVLLLALALVPVAVALLIAACAAVLEQA